MDRWIASVAMLCPVVYRTPAAFTASQMSGVPSDFTTTFFSRAVGPIGGAEITHYLAHSRVRESTLAQLSLLSHAYPGAHWTVTRHDDQPDLHLSVAAWLASLGMEFKDQEDDE